MAWGSQPHGKGLLAGNEGEGGGGGGHGTQQGVAGSEGAGSLGARWPVDAVGRQAKTCRGWAGPGRRSRQQHVPSRRSGRPWIPDPVEGPHRRCGCGCPPLPHAPPPPTLPPPRRSVAMGSGQHRRDGVGGGGCCLGKREGGGVRTGLRAASSRRLRPHRRGVGADSRGDPEGPARLPRDGAPTGPGEQEWLGPSPAPGSSLLPTVPAPPLPGPGDFNPWRQRAPTPPLLTGA